MLAGRASVAEVAAVHLEALDAQIRTLRLRRGVLAAVVKRAADGKEMAMMNALARLSAAERRQIIDDFTDEVFAGLDPSPARSARWAASDPPDDPSPGRSRRGSSWPALASDPDFRQRIRQVVTEVGIAAQAGRWLLDDRRAQQAAGEALRRGSTPGFAEGARVLEAILAGTAGSRQRGRCWPSWRPAHRSAGRTVLAADRRHHRQGAVLVAGTPEVAGGGAARPA